MFELFIMIEIFHFFIDRFYNKMERFIRTNSKYESERLMYQLRNSSRHLIGKEQKTTFDFTGISHRKIRLFICSFKQNVLV